MHSTTLVPKGLYKVEDPVENPREIVPAEPEGEEETVRMPSTADMGVASNWLHF